MEDQTKCLSWRKKNTLYNKRSHFKTWLHINWYMFRFQERQKWYSNLTSSIHENHLFKVKKCVVTFYIRWVSFPNKMYLCLIFYNQSSSSSSYQRLGSHSILTSYFQPWASFYSDLGHPTSPLPSGKEMRAAPSHQAPNPSASKNYPFVFFRSSRIK